MVKQLARVAISATGGNTLTATMLILVASVVISGVIDNVPYAATMAPVVADLVPPWGITPIPASCGGRSRWAPTSAAT
ncbi:arsA domain protein [Mycobacterium intracellulare 1956]|uniref:ArsA domain protein n=1 Tax=Mycobacterium intracellulare 1956 TaxID=1299331 RepID=X8CJK0_MYCIT|nr:arsA domain protein [Mycobacterium intracellulare 1956]